MPKPKYQIQKSTKVNSALVPIIKDLADLGYSEADIGVIVAAAGKHPQKWFNNLKKKYPKLENIAETADTLANIQLVVAAMQAALGYDYIEEEIKYEQKQVLGTDKVKPVEVDRKVKHKHAKKDKDLLKFLLINRLPAYFSDTKKIDMRKPTGVKGNPKEELAAFAGRLLNAVSKDAKFEEIKDE